MHKPAIDWVINIILTDLGYHPESDRTYVVQSNPWSSVYRFLTDQGYIFLKQIPQALSLEPKVTDLSRDQFYANVPTIIADNMDLH